MHPIEISRWSGGSRAATAISVLIPCWHVEKTIGGALDSIETQRGLPADVGIEIVVVIDGREQDDFAVRRWITNQGNGRRCSITVVRLATNSGAGTARKVGNHYCHGDFLAFLDDDDIWHNRKLAIQWSWHQANPDRIASSHGYETTCRQHNVRFAELLIGGTRLPTPTLMIRRSLWLYEPEHYRFSEDWLMLAMIASHQPIAVLPFALASRSTIALDVLDDEYSLSRQSIKLRAGKMRAIIILAKRGCLNPFFIAPLIALNFALAVRRSILNGFFMTKKFFRNK